MAKQHVIIVGAGASGLIAAMEISKKCDVTILETNKSTGGRIRSFALPNGEGIVEPGASPVDLYGSRCLDRRLGKDEN